VRLLALLERLIWSSFSPLKTDRSVAVARGLMNNSARACGSRGFKALMATQFLGALNDNIFRFVVSLVILDVLFGEPGQGGTSYLAGSEAVFLLPFVLFSPIAGFLADRYSKTTIIRATKIIEIIVMMFGAWFLVNVDVWGLVAVLMFMGLQSTLFSPAKYGILPEILDDEHLSRGNGYLEFWTFLAIILGIVLGGVLKNISGDTYNVPAVAVLVVAVLGIASSLFVAPTTSSPNDVKCPLNPFRDAFACLREVRNDRNLFLVLLAISYFWILGSAFKLTAILYAKNLAGLGEMEIAILFAMLAVGIGIGSIVAGTVSGGKIELGLVPIGSIGISIFSSLLTITYQSFPFTLFAIFFLGVFSGFFIVPLNSFFQHNSPIERRGRYLATMNFVSFSGMIFACFLVWLLIEVVHLPENYIFLGLGIASAAVTVIVCRQLPEMFVRCVNWILVHTVYRVRVVGKEHVPAKGGALLICNHATYIDASLLLSSIERPIRFLIHRPIYEGKFVKPIARVMKAIPIAAGEHPKEVAKSLSEARSAIENGELVCIFAEGGITRTGQLLKFNKGFERIMKRVDAPIIPVYLDQVWGSIFSFSGGKVLWKRPKEIPYPVTVVYGERLPSTAKTHQVRVAVQELGSKAFSLRPTKYKLLHLGFLALCKQHPFRTCLVDSSGARLSYIKTLTVCLSLAKELRKSKATNGMIGVYLPPCVQAAIANIAIMIAGRVPVNLNFTSGKSSLDSAISQCGIETTITSKAFLEKLGDSNELPGPLYCEEIFGSAGAVEMLKHFLAAFLLPLSILRKLYVTESGVRVLQDGSIVSDEDGPGELDTDNMLATIIFSSGSTGEPKGVMLSHDNISSNLSSLYDVFNLGKGDSVLGVLPFFHSFGFTGTLWLPLLGGMKAVYHNNPMDAAAIGTLADEEKVTVLMTTPTFLLSYIRRVKPEQFESLRYIVVGAEKLKPRVAEAFENKFGKTPMEGYGCTELSPVAVMNVPDYEVDGSLQVGNKLGTVGHPIPGVSAKIVCPDSGEGLEPDTDGLLMIKGPNVMVGYLGNIEKTRSVISDGWYNTGDIANMDIDGFVRITDRLSRFSKIGGEMVPHVRIEEEIQTILGGVAQTCVVTAVPDERKGELLVVLHTTELDPGDITKRLSEAGLPNLWIPKKDYFYLVDELPMLGTGKLDLKKIKQDAVAFSSSD